MATGTAPAIRLLVVDDEPRIRALLSATLGLAGYAVRTAETGGQALAEAPGYRPDLVVLDVVLPDADGFEVARRLRLDLPAPAPVLFLADPAAAANRVAGLTAGGDDLLVKPFSPEEVILRVRAVLRRTRHVRPGADDAVLRYADLELDEDAREAHRDGRRIDLSATEFALLRCLVTRADQVVSRAQILDQVWHYDFSGGRRIVESYMYYLRRKIDAVGPPLIHTVRGVGYVLRLLPPGSR